MKPSQKRLKILLGGAGLFISGLLIGYLSMSKKMSHQSHEVKKTQGEMEKKIKYWQAPMDPAYIRNEPGKSPMGMDLIPVYEDEDKGSSKGGIKIDPRVVQNMGVRLEKVKKGKLEKVVRTVGHLDYDETKVWVISPKMSGWIEKLYITYAGQKVNKGDPLFDIYSPELVSAQEEYLLGRRALDQRGNIRKLPEYKRLKSLYESSRQRLLYWDISEGQINELKKKGKVKKTLTIYSPYSGIVVKKSIQEGQYQKAGTNLYTISDLSSIWVYVHIYEYELPWIKVGLPAEMELSYMPGKIFKGKVTYIYPYLSKKTRDVKVRLEFSNPHLELKPDMYANVRIKSIISEEAIIIPGEAVIDTGSKQIVFVAKGEGRFEARRITVGTEGAHGVVQILDGLEKGETVVTSGQFLLDSESKLQDAIQKMLKGEDDTDMKGMKHEGHEMGTEHDMKGMKHEGHNLQKEMQ